MKRVVLTTGGTGGHIFPALAVAEQIKSVTPDAEILFIGSLYGPEARLAKAAGISFQGLPVRGFLGRGLAAIPAAARMGAAFIRAYRIIKDFRPDVVAAFGGYASFAPGLAARFAGIPLLLHEQNAIAGASNQFLGRFANVICVSMPMTRGFKRETIYTGNPVRAAIKALKDAKKNFSAKRLLVVGGSQGAHGINVFMASILPGLKEAGVEIIHQTGEKDLDFVRQAYLEAGYPAESARPFIDDMAEAYSWASMAFCRSGASTVAELCAAALPAALAPFPAAIHDHQTLNAEALANAGAAIVLREKNFEKDNAVQILLNLLNDPRKLENMAKAAHALAAPRAAENLVAEMEKIALKNGQNEKQD